MKAAPVSTQVIQRDIYAEYLNTLALIASSSKITPRLVTLENGLVRLEFDAVSGSLVSLANKATGMQARPRLKPSPVFVVEAVPFFGRRAAGRILRLLGVIECGGTNVQVHSVPP